MNIIKDMNIRAKLILLFILLLIPIIYFVRKSILDELRKEEILRNIYFQLTQAEKISSLIHELQKERGLTQVQISSQEISAIIKLNVQRKKTDLAILQFQKGLHKEGGLEKLSSLNSLDDYRRRIDDKTFDTLYVDHYYDDIIKKLISHIKINDISIEEPEIKNQITAYFYLLNSIEYLGQVREKVNKFLGVKKFTTKDYMDFAMRRNSFELYVKEFLSSSPKPVLDFYLRKQNNENFILVLKIINEIFETTNIKSKKLNENNWYERVTLSINHLQEVESFALELAKRNMKDRLELAKSRVGNYVVFVVCMSVLAMGISMYIIRIISSSVRSLRKAADKLAVGNTNISLNVHSKDEIGELAESFRGLAKHITHLSEVAYSIGKGNYSHQIDVQGPKDLLGNALVEMRDNLKEFSAKDKTSKWFLTGSALLSDILYKEKNIENLTREVLKHLASYLNAEVGILYLVNKENNLHIRATYAYKVLDDIKPMAIGEGLVGQAAMAEKLFLLKDIPGGYCEVKSGIGKVTPKEIVFLPLKSENKPIGVIELASKEGFNENQLQYLSSVSERIAVVILKMKAEIRTRELLSETKNQAEELEAQHEELRQINEELIAQRSRLQTSEQLLKMNKEELQEKNWELQEKAKQLEEQYSAIQIKNNELEEAREAINLKVEQLETVNKYKSEFLANMSHELRTPLNSILILSKILSENKNFNLSPKQIEFSQIINKSGQELLRLIDDILDLSKIESGKLSLEVKEFYVRDVYEIQSYFKQLAEEKKIDFNIKIADNAPEYIVTDKFRLEQILKNLLSNAFKFTEKGGQISLEVSFSEKVDHLRNQGLINPNEVITFKVRDNGIGIPKDQQQFIFEAFRQADSSTSRKYGGTGLGLSISKELSSLLGGEVELFSEEGKGSVFTLYLPVEFVNADSNEKKFSILPNIPVKSSRMVFEDIDKAPRRIEREEKLKILICEKDPELATILANTVSDFGYECGRISAIDSLRENIENLSPSGLIIGINFENEVEYSLEELHERFSIPILVLPIERLEQKNEQVDPFRNEGMGLESNFRNNLVRFLEEIQSSVKVFDWGIPSGDKKFEGKKILIVDDDIRNIYSLHNVLEGYEMEITTACNGVEALCRLEVNPDVDIIIMDIMMPEMDGYKAIKSIKQNEKLKDIPIIALTAKATKCDKEKCLEEGAADYLSKPVDVHKLIKTIEKWLHGKGIISS